MITLHGSALSGNTHKVRNMLGLLGLDYELAPVDLAAGEHKSEAFLALNPLGQIPLLIDGETTLRDSGAILVYLAESSNEVISHQQGEGADPSPAFQPPSLQSFFCLASFPGSA